jgi:colicin import membrane protein
VPDIKAEQARREAERKEEERRLAERKAAERKAAERKEAERKEADRRAEEKRAAERKLAEQKAAEEKRAKDEQVRREAERKAADEKRRAEQARRDAEAAEQRRTEDIRRLQSQAGTSGTPSDQAVRGAATGRVDAGYAARVAAAIRTNTTYQVPGDLEGNPKAVFLVALRPDCSVSSVRLRKSSGVPAWDQAAERGIQRTDPFPRPPDGTCQGELEIVRGPRDER